MFKIISFKFMSSVEIYNLWLEKYTKEYLCYLDFLEFVENKKISNL